MIRHKRIGLLGAGGQIGRSILPLLTADGADISAFVRGRVDGGVGANWMTYDADPVPALEGIISTMPVWELPGYFDLIERSGATRLVVLSSTSLFSKTASADPAERELARRIETGERQVTDRASARNLEWVILRPTMVYGRGRDHNVSSLLRFIQRFGFLPVLGTGRGLRQPVYVDDVAQAAVAALESEAAANRGYNLSGGETLSYLDMCRRLFAALDRCPRILKIPVSLFTLIKPLFHLLPQRHGWLVPMLERMNTDLVFDHGDAVRDLGFSPRPFGLSEEDLRFESSRIIP